MPATLSVNLIRKAREVLADHVHVTPVVSNTLLSDKIGARVFLKLESLQRGGSFKVRGATNFIDSLVRSGFKGRLVAASAGNHAQGVALAAREFGLSSRIYMPQGAVNDKVESTRGFGAEVVLHGSNLDEAVAAALADCRDDGAQLVHPYEHPLVMAGQGTVGLEIHEQCPEAMTVVIPVGGGGLISGIATALKNLNPNIHIVGVQAEVAGGMTASFQSGSVQAPPFTVSLADGISIKKPSAAMYDVLKDVVDEMVTVSEASIKRAMLLLILRGKVLSEGAGAVAVAALLENKVKIHGRSVLAVVSGANVDPHRIVDLMDGVV